MGVSSIGTVAAGKKGNEYKGAHFLFSPNLLFHLHPLFIAVSLFSYYILCLRGRFPFGRSFVRLVHKSPSWSTLLCVPPCNTSQVCEHRITKLFGHLTYEHYIYRYSRFTGSSTQASLLSIITLTSKRLSTLGKSTILCHPINLFDITKEWSINRACVGRCKEIL